MDNLSLRLALENGNGAKYVLETEKETEKCTVINKIFLVNNEKYLHVNTLNKVLRAATSRLNNVKSTKWMRF